MLKKEEYIEKIGEQLKGWTAKINELKAKADRAVIETKTKVNQQILALNQKKMVVTQKLQEVRKANKNAWEHLKEGVEKACQDLAQSLRSAKGKFK